MIAGLGEASQLVVDNIPSYQVHMRTVRDYLEESLKVSYPVQMMLLFMQNIDGNDTAVT